MGAVITFPECRRALRASPTQGAGADATVIILPVVRIEREDELPSDTGADPGKSSSGGKRRRRASRP
jgi:hypothetical protein